MYTFDEAFTHVQMIEDGTLITKGQVLTKFLLEEVELTYAVQSENIPPPLEIFGEIYYYADLVELYVFNLRRKSMG